MYSGRCLPDELEGNVVGEDRRERGITYQGCSKRCEVGGSDVGVGPNLEAENDGSMSLAPALVIDGKQARRGGSATM